MRGRLLAPFVHLVIREGQTSVAEDGDQIADIDGEAGRDVRDAAVIGIRLAGRSRADNGLVV